MSNILITGAAGFIGSTLAYKLHNKGENVYLVDNFSYGREDNLIFEDYDFNKEIFKYDIRDEKKPVFRVSLNEPNARLIVPIVNTFFVFRINEAAAGTQG